MGRLAIAVRGAAQEVLSGLIIRLGLATVGACPAAVMNLHKWRGIGTIQQEGYRLRREFSDLVNSAKPGQAPSVCPSAWRFSFSRGASADFVRRR